MFDKLRQKNIINNNDNINDLDLLLQYINEVKEGNYETKDTSLFQDKRCINAFNEMLDILKEKNNTFTMQLNMGMKSLGDNSFIKETFDEITNQKITIKKMQNDGVSLSNSIQHVNQSIQSIMEDTNQVVDTNKISTDNMDNSINMVETSVSKIDNLNDKVQNFYEKINKINSIVDVVKSVADETSLLSLNASIEAARAGESGKGFAVVAGEMGKLANSTSESVENIVMYIDELKEDANFIAKEMNDTTAILSEGNNNATKSLTAIKNTNIQLNNIQKNIRDIVDSIRLQSSISNSFDDTMKNINNGFNNLESKCYGHSGHIYKVSRYIDSTRNNMARGLTNLTKQDWLKVFQIDHFILMWRVYNHIMGIETLKSSQLDNPTTCKLGKWLTNNSDTRINNSNAFREVTMAHNEFHNICLKIFNAKKEDALITFNELLPKYIALEDAFNKLKIEYEKFGDTKITEIISV